MGSFNNTGCNWYCSLADNSSADKKLSGKSIGNRFQKVLFQFIKSLSYDATGVRSVEYS